MVALMKKLWTICKIGCLVILLAVASLAQAMTADDYEKNLHDYFSASVAQCAIDMIKTGHPKQIIALNEDCRLFVRPNYQYINLSTVMMRALSLPTSPIVITDANELRFLTHAMDGVAVVVIAADLTIFDETRIAALKSTALLKDIHLSFVIVPTSDRQMFDATQFAALRMLARDTAGVFLSL